MHILKTHRMNCAKVLLHVVILFSVLYNKFELIGIVLLNLILWICFIYFKIKYKHELKVKFIRSTKEAK